MNDVNFNTENTSNDQIIDLLEAIQRSIEDLPERTADILVRRYGLNGKKRQTLEEIGQHYGITRERVRQIESNSLKDIKKTERFNSLADAVSYIESVLHDHGAIMQHDNLVQTLSEKLPGQVHKNHVEFVLHLADSFNLHKENDHYRKSWYLDTANLDLPKRVLVSFVNTLEERNEPIHENDAIEIVLQDDSVPEIQDKNVDLSKILAYLHLGKRIQRNPFGEWGLSHWSEIAPRGVKDKAYVVLKREGKPLHFTQITDKINEAGFGKRPAISQTVHNELIKDDRFVLVGRGIYALTSWGYKEGTVADVVLDVLRESSDSLTKEEVIKEVLKQRLVKKNTIVLALQNSDKVKKEGEAFVFVESV